MSGFSWVTLATNDSYSIGALVLAHSLRRVRTLHDLTILITRDVTESMREKLSSVFTLVQQVNLLDSKDKDNLLLLQRPELGITFTKIHCWSLVQYEKCVFIDADTLVIKNCDELFEREEFSAAPDIGWPDCFNSGVFVFRPSQETYDKIIQFSNSNGSFDGADQGLLNMYFNDWAHKDISKHLPFIYNMCASATYSYAAAFKQYGENVRIIHFVGAAKPWLLYLDKVIGISTSSTKWNHLQPYLQMWSEIFCDHVYSQLTDTMGELARTFSKLKMNECQSNEYDQIQNYIRKDKWEQGQIDFMGQDSFDNILKKINATIASISITNSCLSEEANVPQGSNNK